MPAAIDGDRPIRWGVIGAGGIAETVCGDIDLTPGNQVAAVAARDPERAAQFATRHGASRSYGEYAALAADDEVDVVYVATTHPNHHDHALLAIDAGKAVMIEKPVGLNAAQARSIYAAARSADVFAMEAMWMRTNPLIRAAADIIADGEIGEVCGLRFEFGLGIAYDPVHRLYDLGNGGGALLDLGVYPATFAFHFLGRPDEVITCGELAASGVDDTVAMQWMYSGRPRAQLWCSLSVAAPNQAAILGSHGFITFDAQAYRPAGLTIHSGGSSRRVADPLAEPLHGKGYGPQIQEVERCLRAGLTESPLVPQADTVEILTILDRARAALGVRYPTEG